MHNKKFLIYIFKILLVLIGAFAILVVAVNFASQNRALTTKFIKFQITRLLDLDSEVVNPHAYIDWDLQYKIRADKLTFIEKNADIVTVDDLHVDVFLPYLLFRKIFITNMNGQNLYVNFERYKTNKINIIEIFNITGFFKVYFHNSSISINKYHFNFTDNYHVPSENMVVTGDNILISKFSLKKYVQLIMDGKIDYNNTITPFSVNYNSKFPNVKKNYNLGINLPDFDFGTFRTYIKEFAPDVTLKGKGSIWATISENKFVNLFLKVRDVDLHSTKNEIAFKFKNEISLVSRFAYENYNFIIDEFKVYGNDFSASTYGRIYDIKSLPLEIDLHVKVDKNSNLNSISKILPYGIPVLNYAIDKVKNYNIGGIADGEVYAKGKIGYLNVDGFVDVHEVDLGYDSKLPKSTAKLIFKNDKLDLTSVVYPNYNKNESVKVTGNIKITKPFVLDLNVSSSKNMDLKKVVKPTLISADIFNFKTGPLNLMNITSGTGNINLAVKGTPPDVKLYGEMFFSNGVVSYEGLNGKLYNVSGQLDFAGDDINYKNIKGMQDNFWAYAHGQTKLREKGLTHFYLDIPTATLTFAKKYIDNSPLLYKVSSALQPVINPIGTGSLNMVMISDENNTTEPYTEGTVTIDSNSSCNYQDIAYRFENVSGNVQFNNTTSILNLQGVINGINTKMTGDVTAEYSNVEIVTNNADIQKAYDVVYKSPLLSKDVNLDDEFSNYSGTIETKTILSGDFAHGNAKFYTEVDILPSKLKYMDIPEYFYINEGKVFVRGNDVILENIKGSFYENPFSLNGTIFNQGTKNEKRNIVFETSNFNLKNINSLVNTKALTPEAKELLNNFVYQSGSVDMLLNISLNNATANVSFHNAIACYKPTKKVINIPDGEFFFSDDSLKMKKLFVQLDDSDLIIDGFVKNYQKNPYYNLHIASDFCENDFNKTIAPILNLPVQLIGQIYTNIDFTGTTDNWNLQARAMFDDMSYVSYKGANLGKDLSKFMFFDLSGKDDNITINTFDVYSDNVVAQKNNSNVMAKIKGNILKLSSDSPVLDKLEVNVYDYMNLSFLNILFYNPDKQQQIIENGLFKGDLFLNGDLNNLNINGKAEVKNALIPIIDTTVNEMNLDFKNNLVNIEDANINIAGNNVNIDATLNNIYTTPITFDKLKLTSDFVDFNKIISTFEPAISSFSQSEHSSSQEKKLPVITIKQGDFDIKQLAYKKMLMTNTCGEFSIDEKHWCSLKNLKSESDNAKLNGDIDYNLVEGDLQGNIELTNVVANNFASTFLNLPNEIYGSLDSNIKFSSKGKTNEELIKNLNGVSYFKINNGRMIRLGSVEYMLRVANTFKGGIQNLNLNAIVNIVAPRTGYFDNIEGDIQIHNGVIVADKIISQSSELNLFLTGSYNMNDSYVNATVIGQMPTESKDSILWLGPIGKISLNSLVKKLTRNVSKDDNEFLYNPLAYINEIPGLKNNKGDFRFFVVSLKGDLYNDKYVHDFKWIK